MRCFAAIELPDEAIALAGELRRAIISADERWRHERWVAEENLHVTLAFFGDVGEESVVGIADVLRNASVSPFELTSPGFSAIPNARHASMAWLSFGDETGDGTSLAMWARVAGSGAGIAAEEPSRAYKPHVTLVRARRPRRLSAEARSAAADVLARAGDVRVSVSSVSVFSSTLTPSGPRYQLLETVPLRHA